MYLLDCSNCLPKLNMGLISDLRYLNFKVQSSLLNVSVGPKKMMNIGLGLYAHFFHYIYRSFPYSQLILLRLHSSNRLMICKNIKKLNNKKIKINK